MNPGRHHDPVQRLNDHHADDLLATARAFGHPDATSARAERIDHSGIDLALHTPRGPNQARVDFTQSVADTEGVGLRRAFTELARRARATLAAESNESNAS